MAWFNRVLYKLSAYCRCRVINGPDQQPYLERYHLMRLPFGYRVYLHRFVASDPGRGLHNHPWKHAISLLLCGCYRETRMLRADANHALQQRELHPGRLNFISGDVFHRINLPRGSECWSLFVHAARTSDWGFFQQCDYQGGYQDHNEVVTQASNPLWWKQALRPIHCPQMRMPASGQSA
ncbi:MAG: hypothetical protein GY815_17835 [Gammaproteobacteria bacterium]|nr:hypothetical protein [Gammaproteobacteria bacterium]